MDDPPDELPEDPLELIPEVPPGITIVGNRGPLDEPDPLLRDFPLDPGDPMLGIMTRVGGCRRVVSVEPDPPEDSELPRDLVVFAVAGDEDPDPLESMLILAIPDVPVVPGVALEPDEPDLDPVPVIAPVVPVVPLPDDTLVPVPDFDELDVLLLEESEESDEPEAPDEFDDPELAEVPEPLADALFSDPLLSSVLVEGLVNADPAEVPDDADDVPDADLLLPAPLSLDSASHRPHDESVEVIDFELLFVPPVESLLLAGVGATVGLALAGLRNWGGGTSTGTSCCDEANPVWLTSISMAPRAVRMTIFP